MQKPSEAVPRLLPFTRGPLVKQKFTIMNTEKRPAYPSFKQKDRNEVICTSHLMLNRVPTPDLSSYAMVLNPFTRAPLKS
jgi:hypothetical protein